MDFILDFIIISVAFSLGAILTRFFFPQTEIVISEPIEVEVESEADKQQIEFLKGQINYAHETIKDQRQRILAAVNDMNNFKASIEKAIIMAKALEAENASLKAALAAKEEQKSIKPTTVEVANNMEVPTHLSVQRLKAQLFNGDVKAALSTYNPLVLAGNKPNLLEVVAVLKSDPSWSHTVESYKEITNSFNPYGSDAVVKERAVEMFLDLTAVAKQQKRLDLVAALLEAAHLAIHGDIGMAWFTCLGERIAPPFSEDMSPIFKYYSWEYIFEEE